MKQHLDISDSTRVEPLVQLTADTALGIAERTEAGRRSVLANRQITFQDQQAAGLVMWIPPGIVYAAAALFAAARWIDRSAYKAE